MVQVKDSHPAIIDSAIFELVQREIDRRAGTKKADDLLSMTGLQKYSGKYALSGLLVCSHCGSPYTCKNWTKTRGGVRKEKYVWRCQKRQESGNKYCHRSPALEETALQLAVLEAINEAASIRSSTVEQVINNILSVAAPVGEQEQARLGQQL